MSKITRRSMLAAVPAMGMAPIVPAMAEPVKTPRELAKWHIRELHRLISEDGGANIIILASAAYGDRDDRTMGINYHGEEIDRGDMFNGTAA